MDIPALIEWLETAELKAPLQVMPGVEAWDVDLTRELLLRGVRLGDTRA
jgi:hypothetical protein